MRGRYYELLKEASGTNIFIDGSYPVDETKTLVQLLRAAEHNEQEEAGGCVSGICRCSETGRIL